MKAKVKSSGELVDVIDIYPEEINGEPANPFVQYYRNKDREEVYGDFELDFNIAAPGKEIVEGWVMRDDNNDIALFPKKPTCDEDGDWDLTGDYYVFDKKLFPQITPSSEPRRVRIEITLIDEKGE